jgi:hypothetical protein
MDTRERTMHTPEARAGLSKVSVPKQSIIGGKCLLPLP